jgi:hypothetical protein
MVVVRTTKIIIKCSPRQKNDMPAVKLPVHILEAMLFNIGMFEQDFMHRPVF